MGKHKKVKSRALAGPLPPKANLSDQICNETIAKSKISTKNRNREDETSEVRIIAH